MKIAPESIWLLYHAFESKDVNEDFLKDVYYFIIAQMEGRGDYPQVKSSNYASKLQELVTDYKTFRKITTEQANEACRELIATFQAMQFVPTEQDKYADVDDNPDFSDFITDELVHVFDDALRENYTPSFYLASVMVCLYYYAYIHASPSYDTPLDQVVAKLAECKFMEMFRSLDYQTDANKMTGDYENSKNVEDSILKMVKPIDTTHMPDYMLEDSTDYVFANGNWYSYNEIEKAITASSQVASALERQDLEGGEPTNSGHRTAAQIIEGFRLQSIRRKEKYASRKPNS